MRHWIIVSAALLLTGIGEHVRGTDAATLEAIGHCRSFIRKAQLEDGAFRFTIKDEAVRISPYFGNTAARALLVAHKLEAQADDLERVRRWLDWYAAHMRDDGTILDFHGTIASYEASPKRDSIDVYPPSYLAANSDPPNRRLWDNLRGKFAAAPRLTPDLWLAAARRCGTADDIQQYTAAAIQRARSDDLTLQTAPRLLLALAGDAASPVSIPLNLAKK